MTLVCSSNGSCTIVHCYGKHYILNYKASSPDIRDRIYKPRQLKHKGEVNLQSRMPRVWDQGDIGSCVAQSLASTIMFCMKKPFVPSRLFIYYCARVISNLNTNEDTGVEMRMGCKAIAKYGFCNEDLFPYNTDYKLMPSKNAFEEALKHRNYIYESLPIEVDAMMSCLDEGYPFVIGIMVHNTMFDQDVITSGNMKTPNNQDELVGGHAITIVGYNKEKQHFIVRNSWGEKWGNQGYGTIPFSYIGNKELALDAWVLKCKPHH
jgi:C1A family cysteine protease